MALRIRTPLWASSALFMACMHADVQLDSRLLNGAAAHRTLLHPHTEFEERYELPPGSLTEEATLDSADEGQLCFAVMLRSFSVVDLRTTEISLSADGDMLPVSARVVAERPSTRTYQGLVYKRKKTGERLECVGGHRDDGACREYGTVAAYSDRAETGEIAIHESRGRVCFPGQTATPAKQLALRVRISLDDGERASRYAAMPGGASRKQVFRWGITPTKS